MNGLLGKNYKSDFLEKYISSQYAIWFMSIVQKELQSCIAIDELPFLITENTCFNLVIAKWFNKLWLNNVTL